VLSDNALEVPPGKSTKWDKPTANYGRARGELVGRHRH
jgi:hypothetical protein